MFKSISQYKKQIASISKSIEEDKNKLTKTKKEFDKKWEQIGMKNLSPGKKLP